MGWVIFVIVVVLVGRVLFKRSNEIHHKVEEAKKSYHNQGLSLFGSVPVGAYVGGHPNIDNTVNECSLAINEGNLVICQTTGITGKTTILKKLGEISKESIEQIEVLDKSEMERKVTVGRIFLVGVFALAWKKKTMHEAAYLTIEWKLGKFDHTTIFQLEGKDSLQKANTARNSLIKIVA